MADNLRSSHIYRRAHALAASGFYESPRAIIAALVSEGYPEAAELLDSRNIHADLMRVREEAYTTS